MMYTYRFYKFSARLRDYSRRNTAYYILFVHYLKHTHPIYCKVTNRNSNNYLMENV